MHHQYLSLMVHYFLSKTRLNTWLRKHILTISNIPSGKNFIIKLGIISSIFPLVKLHMLMDAEIGSNFVSQFLQIVLATSNQFIKKIREKLKLEGVVGVQLKAELTLQLDQVVLELVPKKFECFQGWIWHGTLSICFQCLPTLSIRNIHEYLCFLMPECMNV